MTTHELNIWCDIDSRFNLDLNSDILIQRNLKSLEQSVENILMTSKGERVMRPNFGSRLETLLFEKMSDEVATRIGQEVLMALAQEDRIAIHSVEITPYYDKSCYMVELGLNIKPLNLRYSIVRILVHQL